MGRVTKGKMKGVVGRVAGITFYKQGNRTMARESLTDRVDPKTDSQMSQRVRLPNIVHFWHVFREVPLKMWESDSSGLSDYNRFVKENLNDSALPITKDRADNGATYLWSYLIARGTMFSPQDMAGVNGDVNLPQVYLLPGLCSAQDEVEKKTVGWFAQQILAENRQFLPGDEWHLLAFRNYMNWDLMRWEVVLDYVSIPMDPDSTELLENYGITNMFDDVRRGFIFWQGGEGCHAYANFFTRKTKTKILVSTARIKLAPDAVFYNGYTDEWLEECIQSYNVTDDFVLDADVDGTGYDNNIQTHLQTITGCYGGSVLGYIPMTLDQFWNLYADASKWQAGGNDFQISVSNYETFYSLVLKSSTGESMTFKRESQIKTYMTASGTSLLFRRSASQKFLGATIASIKITDRSGISMTYYAPTANEEMKVELGRDPIVNIGDPVE